jgi:hypothetical protein
VLALVGHRDRALEVNVAFSLATFSPPRRSRAA